MANGWGGARAGAGRKRKPAAKSEAATPLEFLIDVALGRIDPNRVQMRAAIALLPYFHTKPAGSSGEMES